ncbi:MAG: hypothetical protein ACREHG_08120 [Candidatus Saccharimonadales bacterium]
MDGIVNGAKPSEAKELAEWKAKDKMMVAIIYSKIDGNYKHLVEDLESGQEAWKTLREKFERSTMGQRMKAREEFYAVKHDPSKPIDLYIQELTAAKKKLKTLGHNIEDTEFKDVLLLQLHPSFLSVRTTILSQKDEPSLNDIKMILLSSTSADVAGLTVNIKEEEVEFGLYAGRGRNFGNRSTGQGQGQGQGPLDDRGYRWCDPTSGGCHRCGRTNHVAARCMFNMPDHIKDWIMSNSSSPPRQESRPRQEQSNLVKEEYAKSATHNWSTHTINHSSSPSGYRTRSTSPNGPQQAPMLL